MNRTIIIVLGLLAVLLTACLCQSYLPALWQAGGRQAAGIMENK